MEEIKFSPEILKSLNEIKNEYQNITIRLGQLEIEKKIISKKAAELDSEYTAINNKELVLIKQIRDTYGIGTLNLDTGTFIPNK